MSCFIFLGSFESERLHMYEFQLRIHYEVSSILIPSKGNDFDLTKHQRNVHWKFSGNSINCHLSILFIQ